MTTTLPYPTIEATGDTDNGRTEWRLVDPFILEVSLGRGVFAWEVPAGFTTDFMSTPRVLSWFISPTDPQILVPSLIHDDLYRSKTITSRFMADAWFRDLMRAYGAPMWKRVMAYYAVRVFGWGAFQK